MKPHKAVFTFFLLISCSTSNPSQPSFAERRLTGEQMDLPSREDIEYQNCLHYEKESEKGDIESSVKLADCYRHDGLGGDYAKAKTLYETAALRGHAYAQARLGSLYSVGSGVPRNDKIANQWFEKSAQQGNALGQYQLAMQYESGHGVKKDRIKAISLLEKSSQNGNSEATVALKVTRDKLAEETAYNERKGRAARAPKCSISETELTSEALRSNLNINPTDFSKVVLKK